MKLNSCLLSITAVPIINSTTQNWVSVRHFPKANASCRKEISSNAKPFKPNLKSSGALCY